MHTVANGSSKAQNKEASDREYLLRFARKQREDGLTATLHMKLRLGRSMILVKTQGHTTLMLEIQLSDTVFDLKAKIEETEGIPTREQQRLLLAGWQLADDPTLGCYGIQKGSTVHMVVWSYLRGGYSSGPIYLPCGLLAYGLTL